MKRLRVAFRRLLRKFFHHEDPPERVARGIAAGFFATALPLPGIQIPLSLFFAWLVRGNKAVSVLPQFLANALTMPFFVWLEFRIGVLLWPGKSQEADAAIAAVKAAGQAWSWSQPWQSLTECLGAVLSLGSDVIGPFAIGMVVVGLGLAAATYPLSIIALTYYYAYRLRRRALRGIGLKPRPPLLVPFPSTEEAAHLVAPGMFRYAPQPEPYANAEAVRLLFDEETFPAMIQSIDAATSTVDLETYILRADKAGQAFATALKAATHRGVRVRLMFDGVGSMDLPQEYIDDLLNNSVSVASFRPMNKLFRLGFGPMNRRDHRKILVVDKRVSYTGGLNIADEYGSSILRGESNGETKDATREKMAAECWRDTHCRIDSVKTAEVLSSLFEETWQKADHYPFTANAGLITRNPTGEPRPADDPLPLATATNAPVNVLSNREFLQRWRVRKAYIHAIKHARRYILIENAYFIPDRQFRRALLAATRRGVKVAVILPQNSDIKIIALASKALYGELLSHGVRIFEHPDRMVHSKVAVIDDVWSLVGSYNLDHRSLLHNLEVGVVVLNRQFAEKLRTQILLDSAKSNEITLQFHDARPWNVALVESLAYQMRYWL